MSSVLSPQARFNLVRSNFTKLGLTLPSTLTEELEKIDAALTRSDGLGSDGGALAAAVFDALYADKPPTSTKVMQEALLVELGRMNVRQLLDEQADRRRAAALEQHAEALIAAMSPVIEEADAAFAYARDGIPGLSLESTVAAGLQASQMEAWGRARDAVARVDSVMATWFHIAAGHREYRLLVVAELTAQDLRKLGVKASAAELATAGHRLSLAGSQEYRERVAAVEQERAEATEKAERDAEHYARTGRPADAPVPALRVPWGAMR